MKSVIINKSLHVNAPLEKVWLAFTDPAVTKAMGGEYVSDWKVDGAIGWKGGNGKMYTHGKILRLDEHKIIKHSLLDMNDKDVLLSVITYQFLEKGGVTTIEATEELNYEVDDKQLAQVSEGWDYALQAVKETAEQT